MKFNPKIICKLWQYCILLRYVLWRAFSKVLTQANFSFKRFVPWMYVSETNLYCDQNMNLERLGSWHFTFNMYRKEVLCSWWMFRELACNFLGKGNNFCVNLKVKAQRSYWKNTLKSTVLCWFWPKIDFLEKVEYSKIQN